MILWSIVVVIVLLSFPSHVISMTEDMIPVEPEKVTILEWQYCQSCKLTVELYGQLFYEQMNKMYQRGPKPDNMLNSSEIVSKMCDNPFFDQFQPFVRYGCIKTIEDAGIKFLQQYSGQANALDIINKAAGYRRRKEVCSVHTTACSPNEFDQANITSKARTTCKGCNLIGTEISLLRKISIAEHDFPSLKLTLKESKLCDRLVQSFMPYNWLEWICEEMLDEYLDSIIDIFKFHDQIIATGLNPDETPTDMMCKEFYHCKKPKTKTEL